MVYKDIPLGKAELMGVVMEGVLYGFSLLMFGGTIWALLSRRSTYHINIKMLAAACALLLFSTTHFVINIIRLMIGFVLYQKTGTVTYFSDTTQWTYVAMAYVFTAHTLLGLAVIIYRCHVVWQSKPVLILPVLLWCGVAATGIGGTYVSSQMQHASVYYGLLSHWITSFVAVSFIANVVGTLLLASRVWYVDRKATKMYGPGRSQLRPMLHIILDAGLIYSFTLLVGLISFVLRSNLQDVFLSMATPIISITFYMVIIRAGLSNRVQQRFTTADASINADPRHRMQVHITTMTEMMIEDGRPTSVAHIDSANSDHNDDKRSCRKNEMMFES